MRCGKNLASDAQVDHEPPFQRLSEKCCTENSWELNKIKTMYNQDRYNHEFEDLATNPLNGMITTK